MGLKGVEGAVLDNNVGAPLASLVLSSEYRHAHRGEIVGTRRHWGCG